MSQLALAKWGDQAADALRFRVGSMQVVANISGKEYRVSTCSIVYADHGLPSATIAIPLGKEVGALADEQAKPLFDPTVFKKFAPVKLIVRFGAVTLDDEKIDVANDANNWLALDGFVSAVQFSFAGIANAQASIQILSNLANVSASNSVFGRFTMLHSAQSYIPMPEGGAGMSIHGVDPTKSDTWGLVLDIIRTVLGGTTSAGVGVEAGGRTVVAELMKNEGNPSVQRLIRALEPITGSAAAETLGAFISHTEVAVDTMDELVKAQMWQRLQALIVSAIKAGQSEGTLLAQLMDLASALNLRIAGLASKAHVFHYWPTWTSTNIRVLPSGASFQLGSTIGAGQDASTIAVGALVASFSPGTDISQQMQSQMYKLYCGSYLIPNAASYGNHALFITAPLPSYLGTVGVGVTPETSLGGLPPVSTLMSAADPPPAPPLKAAAPQNFSKNSVIAKAYGRAATYANLFGPRETLVVTAMRQDIIPGCNLRVDNPIINEEAGAISLVGYVSEVTISIDANANIASSSYILTHVRYVKEQLEIIDAPDEGVANAPFLWQDRTQELNALTLWDKQ